MLTGELAEALDLPLIGDPNTEIRNISPIDIAKVGDLSFISDARYTQALQSTQASLVIVPEHLKQLVPGSALISKNPYASYAKASWLLKPEQSLQRGIHPSAVIDSSSTLGAGVSIGAGAVIGEGCQLENGVTVGANTVIGNDVCIGENSTLFPNVTIFRQVSIGSDCRIQSGAVLGSEGFGFAWEADQWIPIQQTGGLHIGNRVFIGANTTIDCGALEPTQIEDGVILDNQIQIAHNVVIGRNTAIAGCVGIAGSTHIGAYCQIGGACNIVGHLTIADKVIINAGSLISRSITKAGRYGSGTPLLPEKSWRRSFVYLTKLDNLFKRVKKLEQRAKIKP